MWSSIRNVYWTTLSRNTTSILTMSVCNTPHTMGTYHMHVVCCHAHGGQYGGGPSEGEERCVLDCWEDEGVEPNLCVGLPSFNHTHATTALVWNVTEKFGPISRIPQLTLRVHKEHHTHGNGPKITEYK